MLTTLDVGDFLLDVVMAVSFHLALLETYLENYERSIDGGLQ